MVNRAVFQEMQNRLRRNAVSREPELQSFIDSSNDIPYDPQLATKIMTDHRRLIPAGARHPAPLHKSSSLVDIIPFNIFYPAYSMDDVEHQQPIMPEKEEIEERLERMKTYIDNQYRLDPYERRMLKEYAEHASKSLTDVALDPKPNDYLRLFPEGYY